MVPVKWAIDQVQSAVTRVVTRGSRRHAAHRRGGFHCRSFSWHHFVELAVFGDSEPAVDRITSYRTR
jgi:hypothetical protein